MTTKSESMEALAKLGNDESRLHLIAQATRPGVTLFMVRMEYENYPPRSGRNKLFDLRIVKWPGEKDFELHWSVMSVPIADKEKAVKLAEECGLRLANGTPVVLGGEKKEQWFPVQGPTAFTLENVPGHKVYDLSQEEIAEELKKERDHCDAILEADRANHREELIKKGYVDQQIDRMFRRWDNGDENYFEPPFHNN